MLPHLCAHAEVKGVPWDSVKVGSPSNHLGSSWFQGIQACSTRTKLQPGRASLDGLESTFPGGEQASLGRLKACARRSKPARRGSSCAAGSKLGMDRHKLAPPHSKLGPGRRDLERAASSLTAARKPSPRPGKLALHRLKLECGSASLRMVLEERFCRAKLKGASPHGVPSDKSGLTDHESRVVS